MRSSDVAIAIEDRTILAVGRTANEFVPDEMIDGREYVALPAFFNAHVHAFRMVGTPMRQMRHYDA